MQTNCIGSATAIPPLVVARASRRFVWQAELRLEHAGRMPVPLCAKGRAAAFHQNAGDSRLCPENRREPKAFVTQKDVKGHKRTQKDRKGHKRTDFFFKHPVTHLKNPLNIMHNIFAITKRSPLRFRFPLSTSSLVVAAWHFIQINFTAVETRPGKSLQRPPPPEKPFPPARSAGKTRC